MCFSYFWTHSSWVYCFIKGHQIIKSNKLLRYITYSKWQNHCSGLLSFCIIVNHPTSISCLLFQLHLTFTVPCFPMTMVVSCFSQAGTRGWYISRRAVLYSTFPTTTQVLCFLLGYFIMNACMLSLKGRNLLDSITC